jgi:hypothetical protein
MQNYPIVLEICFQNVFPKQNSTVNVFSKLFKPVCFVKCAIQYHTIKFRFLASDQERGHTLTGGG